MTGRAAMLTALLGLLGCGPEEKWNKSRVLIKLGTNLNGIAADSGMVYTCEYNYTARRGSIVAVPADGGPHRIAVDDAGQVEEIRVAGGYLYWIASGSLFRALAAGGPKQTLATGGVPALSIDVAEGKVWFTAGMPPRGMAYLYSVPVEGGQPTMIIRSQSGMDRPMPEGAFIYWMTSAGLTRMPRAGGEPAIVYAARAKEHTAGLTRDAAAFYFFEQGSMRPDNVVRYDLATGAITHSPDYIQTALGLLADGGYIYYFGRPNSNNTELRRVPAAGGAPVALDRGYSSGQLAADAGHVYTLTVNSVIAVSKQLP